MLFLNRKYAVISSCFYTTSLSKISETRGKTKEKETRQSFTVSVLQVPRGERSTPPRAQQGQPGVGHKTEGVRDKAQQLTQTEKPAEPK